MKKEEFQNTKLVKIILFEEIEEGLNEEI